MRNYVRYVARPVGLGLSLSVFTIGCSPAEPGDDITKADDAPQTFAPDLLALLPENVPGSELGWLSGRWVRSEKGCSGASYLQASASQEGLHVITAPEPAKAATDRPVQGRAEVNPGENGFTYVTPPDWNDAYLRMKPGPNGEVEVEFVTFVREETRWNVAERFTLKNCQ